MKRIFATLILAGVSLPLLAETATPSAPTITETVSARVDRLTKLLTLTPAQAASATSIFTIEVTAVEPLKASVATAKTALDTAIESNSATEISAAITMIASLHSQILQAEATADAAFYALLTSTQQTVDKELIATGLDFYGGKGPAAGSGSLVGRH